MRYLVTHPDFIPFFTNWFDAENNFTDGMVVYNLVSRKFTIDGRAWFEILEDSL